MKTCFITTELIDACKEYTINPDMLTFPGT